MSDLSNKNIITDFTDDEYNEQIEHKIINQLSNSLKEKLLLESNKLMLKECFASNFSE